MPTARIVGNADAKIQCLIEQLRTRGYEVDLSPPGESAGPPADLEISFETCTAEEALVQAEAFSREKPEGSIFVDSGVMPDLAVKSEPESHAQSGRWWRRWFSRAPLMSASTTPATMQQVPPSELSVPQPAETLLLDTAHLEPSSATVPISPPPAATPAPGSPHAEFAAIVADERSRWNSVLRRQEESRRAELERLAQEVEQREEQRKAREAEIARRNREAETEVLRMAVEAEQVATSPASLPESAPEEPSLSHFQAPLSAPNPVMDVSSIPVSADSEQRVTDLTLEHESLPEPIPTLPVETQPSSPVFATPVSTPAQPTQYAVPEIRLIDTPIELRMSVPGSEAMGANSAAHSELRAASAPRRVFISRRGRRAARTLSPRAREWRIAVISAALFTVVLMGAWSLATNPWPAAPLSLRELQQSNRIQQEVPFGPVRITNEPGGKIAPIPPAAIKAGTTVGAPARIATAPAKKRQSKPSAFKKRAVAPSSGADHDATNDVVVRHFAPAARQAQAQPAQAKAGLRHISDLE